MYDYDPEIEYLLDALYFGEYNVIDEIQELVPKVDVFTLVEKNGCEKAVLYLEEIIWKGDD